MPDVASVPAWQPRAALQVSAPLHNSPSSQLNGVPDWQVPAPSQVSSPLQRSPSGHAVPDVASVPAWQPRAALQVSAPVTQLAVVATQRCARLAGTRTVASLIAVAKIAVGTRCHRTLHPYPPGSLGLRCKSPRRCTARRRRNSTVCPTGRYPRRRKSRRRCKDRRRDTLSRTSHRYPPGSPGLRLQVSAPLHSSPSSQLNGVPDWQVPAPSQVSSPLQRSPSGQAVPDVASVPAWQPRAALQVSAPLHSSPSSQLNGVPDWQVPAPSQVSSPLQRSPVGTRCPGRRIRTRLAA